MSLLFSGCGTKDRGCRAGDNFDGSNTEFDSYKDQYSDDYRDSKHHLLSKDYTLIGWQDTGLATSGETIVLDVSGRWSPWGNSSMKKEVVKTVDGKKVVTMEYIDKVCATFLEGPVRKPIGGTPEIGRYLTIKNPDGEFPCWLSNGMGLYLLFKDVGDPNESEFVVKSPINGTVHLNRKTTPGSKRFVINIDGNDVQDGNGSVVKIKKGMQVYGKIYDSYYLDNYGTYDITFSSGVYKKIKTPLFEGARKYILDPIYNVAKKMFAAIVSDSAYKKGIYALITLYIVATGIMYLMGIIQAQLGELTLRLFKIGLVFVMLTPGAWDFFYNNLFRSYLNGVDQISSIIVSGNAADPDVSTEYMDRITEKVFNARIVDRIVAGFNANLLLGPIYAFFLFIIVIAFAICTIFAFICYIQAMILLYIATVMFPIFITMLLFNTTKSVFQEYINTICGYSFQAVLTFVVLFFMASIIQFEIQRSLGFRMCVAPMMTFNPFGSPGQSSLAKYKDTDSGPVENDPGLTVMSWVPGETSFKTIPMWSTFIPVVGVANTIYELFVKKHYVFRYNEIEKMSVPPLYDPVNLRYRYTALPFLDPDIRLSGSSTPPGYTKCITNPTKDNCHPDKVFPGGIGQDDHEKIVDMMFRNHSYAFFNWGDLFITILLIFVLWELCINYIRTIAEYIGIGGEGYTMPQGTIGSGVMEMWQKFERYAQHMAEGEGLRKYIGMGLSLATGRDFIFKQIGMQTLGSFGDFVDDKFGELKSNLPGGGAGDSDNRFVRFGAQLLGSVYDSVRYESLDSRPIYMQAKDEERDKRNMRGIHKFQDTIGSYFDYAGAMMDKVGSSGLSQGLNPFDSTASKLLGGYEFNPFSSQSNKFGFKENEGMVQRFANAAAGDSINKWSMENGGPKIFEHKAGDFEKNPDGSIKKDADGNPVEASGSGWMNAFGSIFTEDADKIKGYSSIADFGFGEYQDAVLKQYGGKNFDNIDEASSGIGGVPGTGTGTVGSTVDPSVINASADVGDSRMAPEDSLSSPIIPTAPPLPDGGFFKESSGDENQIGGLFDDFSSDLQKNDFGGDQRYNDELNPFIEGYKEVNVADAVHNTVLNENMNTDNNMSNENPFVNANINDDTFAFNNSSQTNASTDQSDYRSAPEDNQYTGVEYDDKFNPFIDSQNEQNNQQNDNAFANNIENGGSSNDTVQTIDENPFINNAGNLNTDVQIPHISDSHVENDSFSYQDNDNANPFVDSGNPFEDTARTDQHDNMVQSNNASSFENDAQTIEINNTNTKNPSESKDHYQAGGAERMDDKTHVFDSSSGSASSSVESDVKIPTEQAKESHLETKDAKEIKDVKGKDTKGAKVDEIPVVETQNTIPEEAKPEPIKENKLSDNSVQEDEIVKFEMEKLNQKIEFIDGELRKLYAENPDDERIYELEAKLEELLKQKGLM